MKKLLILTLATFGLCGYTIKATGRVRVVIVVAPALYIQTIEEHRTIVYTETGPTLQVVF